MAETKQERLEFENKFTFIKRETLRAEHELKVKRALN